MAATINPRKIWQKYAIALGAFLILATVNFSAAQYSLALSEKWAALINDAGRQRMLSQKIILYAEQAHIASMLNKAARMQESLNLLRTTTNEFEKKHQSLLRLAGAMQAEGTIPKEAADIYFPADISTSAPPLDEIVKQYNRHARLYYQSNANSLDDLDRLRGMAQSPILFKLDRVVTAYQKQSEKDTRQLATLELFAFIATLSVIIIEVALIFTPLHRIIVKAITDLEDHKYNLERSLKRLGQAKAENSILSMQEQLAEEMGGFGSWRLNLKTHEVFWSKGIYTIHKRPIKKGIPTLQEAINYYSEEDRENVNKHIEIAVKNKSGFTFEYDLITDEGEKRRVVSTASYVEFENAPYLVGVFKDITTESEVSEQLIKIAKSATSEARNRSDFLAIVSHEIKTPITGITGIFDLLAESNLPEDAKILIRAGQENNHLLLTIVNDLLEMSTLESGIVDLACRPFSAVQLTEQISHSFSLAAKEQNLSFSHVTKGQDIQLYGDDSRIKQVLHTLLDNALKYTEQGAVHLRCEISDENDEKARLVTFTVTDTGIGIPAHKLNDLFIPFEQVEDSFKRTRGGTGLGLAIAHKIAAILGGKLSVTSTEGHGSTFTFSLLVDEDQQQNTAAPRPDEDQATKLPPLKTLVVEDIALNRTLIEKVMGDKWGLNLSFAENGEQAVQLCKLEVFDVIFMDIQMPIMDGVEATEIIRKTLVHHQNTPIYALTANTEPKHQLRYSEVGMDACFSKPFNWRQIKTQLMTLDK